MLQASNAVSASSTKSPMFRGRALGVRGPALKSDICNDGIMLGDAIVSKEPVRVERFGAARQPEGALFA